LYDILVPTGELPLNLSIQIFVAEGETRVTNLSHKQHLAVYMLKKRLLRALPQKVINHPEHALFYMQTVVEIYLHMYMAKEYVGVIRQLPNAVTYLR
jgi:hypothetical protein